MLASWRKNFATWARGLKRKAHRPSRENAEGVVIGGSQDETAWLLGEQLGVGNHLKLISQCSRIVASAKNLSRLKVAICETLHEFPGNSFVWIGAVSDNPDNFKIYPAGHCGQTSKLVELINDFHWDDSPRGGSITGQAIKGKTAVFSNQMARHPSFIPWAEQILQCGIKSGIAIPLMADQDPFGVITIYSRTENNFNESSVEIYRNIADIVSTGLRIGRREEEREVEKQRLKLLARAMESLRHGVIVSDALRYNFPIVYVNPAFERITGYNARDVLGFNERILLGTDLENHQYKLVHEAVAAQKPYEITLKCYRKGGQSFLSHFSVSPVRDEKNTVTHFVTEIHRCG